MSLGQRLLLIVPDIDRADVGESLSWYHWAIGLARRHETTVLTIGRAGVDLGELPDAAEVVEFPEARLHRVLQDRSPTARRYLYAKAKIDYWGFLRASTAWLRANHQRFDLIHQLGPLAPRFPSPFAALPRGDVAPRVIGPVGGGLPTPEPMRAVCRGHRLRDWYVRPDSPVNRRVRDTLECADLVIGVAPYVRDVLSAFAVRRYAFMPEMGFEDAPAAAPDRGSSDVLRLIYVGRIIRTKGLEDALSALAGVDDVPWSLTVVGSGPREAAARRCCRELGLDERVRFRGRLLREATLAELDEHDAMLFPSFREPGGNVVMEALACGLPVITTGNGGPGYMVDDASGIRVAVESVEQFHRDLGRAVRRIADPDLRRAMGAAAVLRARSLGWWPHKIDWMCERYRELQSDRAGARQNR